MPQNSKAAVERQFGSVAQNYSTSEVHARGEDLSQMVRFAGLSGSERLLDAGCGAGHTALAFAPHVAQVIACDLSTAMLEQVERLAHERGCANIITRRGDVENLPFEKAALDMVVSRYSAHHWAHPLAALREFARVLPAGGRCILSDIVAPEAPLLDTFLQSIELLRDPSHVRDYSEAQWLAMFQQAGFEVEIVYRWDLRLDFESWIARMKTPPAHVTAIRSLLNDAPSEVREWLRVEVDYAFTLRGALFRGTVARA